MIARRFVLAATLLLAGCGTSVMQTETGGTDVGRRAVFDWASGRGPVLVEAINAPLAAGDAAASAVAAEHLKGSIPRSDARFTANRQEAGAPDYRLRLAFDAPAGTAGRHVCMSSASRPLVYDRRAQRQTIHMVFCRAEEPIAGVIVSTDRIADLRSDDGREALRQGAQQLFPAGDPRQRGGGIGILQFEPAPRIRINPLEGVF